MSKVVFHIGPHKTGSTYLQRMFVENRDELLSHGILYPRNGQEFLFGHFNLIYKFKKDEELKGDFEIDELEREIHGKDNILLSSEDAVRLNFKELTELKSFFVDREWIIVYYKRNWNDLLHSVWSETVKRGSFLSFKDFVNKQAFKDHDYFKLDHAKNIKMYSEVFGADCVQVLDYDEILRKENLFSHFLNDVLLLKEGHFKIDDKRYNVKLSLTVLAYIRLLNMAFVELNGINPGPSLRINFINKLKEDSSFMNNEIVDRTHNQVFKFRLSEIEYLDHLNFKTARLFAKYNITPSKVNINRYYDYINIDPIFKEYKEKLVEQVVTLMD